MIQMTKTTTMTGTTRRKEDNPGAASTAAARQSHFTRVALHGNLPFLSGKYGRYRQVFARTNDQLPTIGTSDGIYLRLAHTSSEANVRANLSQVHLSLPNTQA